MIATARPDPTTSNATPSKPGSTRPAPRAPRFADRSLHGSVALTVPAVRMVAVAADANRDERGEWAVHAEILPVVAIAAAVERSFLARRKANGEEPSQAATAEGMERAGWSFQGEHLGYEAIVVDEEMGLVPLTWIEASVNVAVELVACPWPADQDESRLAPVVDRVKAAAIAEAERRMP